MERVRKVDQIKEDEMGRASDVLGVEEKCTEFSSEKLRNTTWNILVQMGDDVQTDLEGIQ